MLAVTASGKSSPAGVTIGRDNFQSNDVATKLPAKIKKMRIDLYNILKKSKQSNCVSGQFELLVILPTRKLDTAE
jgi:hypothetical protein